MIGWLQGKVVHRNPAAGIVIVECQGVGWELQVSIQTLASVPAEGGRVTLWVHTHVREDVIALFGFADELERSLFRMLTSVPKVGPRNAVSVLGGFPAVELVECVAARDAGKLVKIPGIGKKTAEQIVLTLADKAVTMLELLRVQGRIAGEAAQTELPQVEENAEFGAEAREVLTSLGWKGKVVDKALASVGEELGDAAGSTDLDAVVRAALAKLMDR
ncbi:Holliday junction branch migration protein RuvA [Pseudenhygromyxa sp. WMMC2535]|uniref:Holliday junction branch migration protein RuvA n=1 Tax=Pseudenhygromyxa sp. WMMC2535 TaxID=2712867 RepID=UPI00155716AC|nr:Holliday junction branch migration protein RuvA [Pseudenhygromyxa sp. WMMC2535]NVB42467.1 Holliday junction branch migration protein RuvA [Pseudenhygromyxa sp. WMMC2535]